MAEAKTISLPQPKTPDDSAQVKETREVTYKRPVTPGDAKKEPGATKNNVERIAWLNGHCNDVDKSNWYLTVRRKLPTMWKNKVLNTRSDLIKINSLCSYREVYEEIEDKLGGGSYRIIVFSSQGAEESSIDLSIDTEDVPPNIKHKKNIIVDDEDAPSNGRYGSAAALPFPGGSRELLELREKKEKLKHQREIDEEEAKFEDAQQRREEEKRRREKERKEAEERERKERERSSMQPIEQLRYEMKDMMNSFASMMKDTMQAMANNQPKEDGTKEILLTLLKKEQDSAEESAKAAAEKAKAEAEARKYEADKNAEVRLQEAKIKADADAKISSAKAEADREREAERKQTNEMFLKMVQAGEKNSDRLMNEFFTKMMDKRFGDPMEDFMKFQQFVDTVRGTGGDEEGGGGSSMWTTLGQSLAQGLAGRLLNPPTQQLPALGNPQQQAPPQQLPPPQQVPSLDVSIPGQPAPPQAPQQNPQAPQPNAQPQAQSAQSQQQAPQQSNQINLPQLAPDSEQRLRASLTELMEMAVQDAKDGLVNPRWTGIAAGELNNKFMDAMQALGKGTDSHYKRLQLVNHYCRQDVMSSLVDILRNPENAKTAYVPFMNAWDVAIDMHRDRTNG